MRTLDTDKRDFSLLFLFHIFFTTSQSLIEMSVIISTRKEKRTKSLVEYHEGSIWKLILQYGAIWSIFDDLENFIASISFSQFIFHNFSHSMNVFDVVIFVPCLLFIVRVFPSTKNLAPNISWCQIQYDITILDFALLLVLVVVFGWNHFAIYIQCSEFLLIVKFK